MHHSSESLSLLILLLSLTVLLTVLLKLGLRRIGIPAAVGYLLLGVAFRDASNRWGWLDETGESVFSFLGTVGVACLLFRVGLQCHLQTLLAQLRRAVRVWVGDFTISGLIGFVTAFYLLDLPLPTSLIVAISLTATSVGVSVTAWEEAGALGSPRGQLMLDVAELDDISGVIAMSILFGVLPALQEGNTDGFAAMVAATIFWYLLKFVAFLAVCYLFSRYVEERLTLFFHRAHPPTDPLLLIVAAGLLIASLAALLGLSVAIGAFFAGVMFSRDPEHVRINASFDSLYEFFAPFFFVHIGLQVDVSVLGPALVMGLILTAAAVVGKVLGNGLPSYAYGGIRTSLLLGSSMMPRAEIAMIVVQSGLDLGKWAMPQQVFNAMVTVSLLTCIASPLIVRLLLNRWQPAVAESSAAG